METQELGTAFEAFANLGAFALVAWLVRHTFSHTIPRLADSFSSALKEQRVEFLTALRQLETDHVQERGQWTNKVDSLSKEFVNLRIAIEAKKDPPR